MWAKAPFHSFGRRVGSEIAITRPSVALRDGALDYELVSQADLVIRVPMGGGTQVAGRVS